MGKKSCADFSVGEKIVYPGYGVGEIVKTEVREMNGNNQLFFIVSFSDSENVSTVMIPQTSFSEIRIRKPSSASTVKKALDFLKNGVPEEFPTWKDRFTAHSAMVQQGDLVSIAQVLKSLHIQNWKKPLSFREKKLYQKCFSLISSEVALVKNKPRNKIEEMIEASLGKKEDGSQSNKRSRKGT
ncbi:MAG: CarD family transcriptional regulator [Acidobacteriota bacterium]